MTPPAMFAPLYSTSFSAPQLTVARPVPSAAPCPQPCCSAQPTCGPSPFRYVHSPYSFSGYEAHRDTQVNSIAPTQPLPPFQPRQLPMDMACPPFPTSNTVSFISSTTCCTATSHTLPRPADNTQHQNQPQIRQHETYLVDDDVSSEETDESEPLSDSTVVCDHYSHWKRLRSKRGNACFVCRLCSAKWKMPTIQAVNFRAIVLSTLPALPIAENDTEDHTDYHSFAVTEPVCEISNDVESEIEDGCGPNCQHVSQWKRLRTKRGAAFFVCFECGCKWRTPAPPTQADRRNGWYYHVFPAMLFGFY